MEGADLSSLCPGGADGRCGALWRALGCGLGRHKAVPFLQLRRPPMRLTRRGAPASSPERTSVPPPGAFSGMVMVALL
jgi:hypothetical protein